LGNAFWRFAFPRNFALPNVCVWKGGLFVLCEGPASACALTTKTKLKLGILAGFGWFMSVFFWCPSGGQSQDMF
jgi:hypothetical protein